MKSKYQTLAEPLFQAATEQLQKWIAIPSVDDSKNATAGKPYGENVFQALRYIGALAEKEGFTVDYCDGHATEISFGRGPIIGVYAHADVVPVSDRWKHPPFGGVIDNGRMYGRGTSDDKGPGLAAFTALKLLKDNHLIEGYSVRLVIGGNEEKGSGCLKYYFHTLKKPYPKYGFTPDGNFPLIYGEKGITNYEIKGKVALKPIRSIKAGNAANAVIDHAVAILDKDPNLEKTLKAKKVNYSVTHDDHQTTVTIHGKAAHGSTPQLGINAGVQLLDVLSAHYKLPKLKTLAQQYADYNGKKLKLYAKTKLMKETTFNVGFITYQDGVFSMVVNYRYPESVDIKKTIKTLKRISPLPVKALGTSRLLLVPPTSPMIKTLVKVYQTETGDLKTQPMTIGGGTYAKEAKNTVAFGSKFPGKEDYIHENDEKIDLEDFTRSISIYAAAIDQLGRLDATKK